MFLLPPKICSGNDDGPVAELGAMKVAFLLLPQDLLRLYPLSSLAMTTARWHHSSSFSINLDLAGCRPDSHLVVPLLQFFQLLYICCSPADQSQNLQRLAT